GQFHGMVFQDSDVAKWLEAAAYSLALKEDASLRARVADIVALIGRAQQKDGYLNTYFTLQSRIPRWSNLLECHELYCAGHMLEAAVALHECAGMDELLHIMLRFVDHIIDRYGENGEEGIPGHQEIELALLRLYSVTGDARHRDMALRFLNLRGQDPDYFKKHTPSDLSGVCFGGYGIDPADTLYNQSDVPARDQTVARGHAVRQVYMLVGMADAAAKTGDAQMAAACRRMFENITQKQMYLTGAIGSSGHLEAFSADYDLPPDRCYGETCASVAMVFFARRMLGLEIDGRYADQMELQLFNTVLAGMQLDGQRYFYVNPLEVNPRVARMRNDMKHVLPVRPKWHACACCPPNLARLLTSLGGYLYSEDDGAVYSHLFVGSRAQTSHAEIALDTAYPWKGEARYTLSACSGKAFALSIHIPAHARGLSVSVNGESMTPEIKNGYCTILRPWQDGDSVDVRFDMPPRRVHANPLVRDCAGQAAIARGPLVYCIEGADNGSGLSCLRLPRESTLRELPYDDALLGGVVPIEADAVREMPTASLYQDDEPQEKPVTLRAIPYYAWSNRGENEMRVFIRA
ncbi:MAG: glycoside hydrolase family 127 protein, partial [Clostridia bacterium]|nr:glycoside hydrolase family 127 protein [Clostridia bacterium]